MPAVAAAESHLPIPPVTESFMSPSPPEDVLPEEMIQITFQDTGPLADASMEELGDWISWANVEVRV